MTYKKKIIWCALAGALLAVVMALAAIAGSRPLGTDWPQFAGTADRHTPPQMVLKVNDPDYGYRLGDAVPLTVCVRYPLGWQVDREGAEITGDFSGFKLTSWEKVVRQNVNYLRLHFQLQSFSSEHIVKGHVNLYCRYREHKEEYPLSGDFSWGTSATWDGRMRLLKPSQEKLSADFTISGALILLGLVGCIWCTRKASQLAGHRPKRAVHLTPRQLSGQTYFEALAALSANGLDHQSSRIIDVTVRTWLHVDAVLVRDLSDRIVDADQALAATTILSLCEQLLFAAEALTPEQCAELARAGAFLFPDAPNKPESPPAGDVQPVEEGEAQ